MSTSADAFAAALAAEMRVAEADYARYVASCEEFERTMVPLILEALAVARRERVAALPRRRVKIRRP